MTAASDWATNASKPPPLRALVWDLETAPMLAPVWSLKPNGYISHKDIWRDTFLICGAWRWLGERRTYSAACDPEEIKRYILEGGAPPDKELVAKIKAVVRRADIIIAHNGDSYDLRRLVGRCVVHKLGPLPSIRTVDTLKEVRKVAHFSSSRLDALAKSLLKDGGKLSTNMGLWLGVLRGNKSSLTRMVRYCKRDVTELERVYLELRPYMKAHPNVSVRHSPSSVLECPVCGGTALTRDGMHRTQVYSFARFRCDECGSWSRSGKSGERKEDDYGLLRSIGGRHP